MSHRPSSTPRRIVALRPGLLVAAVVALLLAQPGCSGGGDSASGPVEPPVVDRTGLEPALAKRLEERLAAVRADPTSAEAWGRLGIAYDVHEYFPEAITCYEQAQTLDPASFMWPYLLGHAVRIGDPPAALAHFQRAATLRTDYAPIPCHIGLLEFESGNIDAADDSLTQALSLDDKHIAALLGRAKVALARNDSKAALFYLDKARALKPKRREVQALYSDAHRMAGSEDDATRYATIAGIDWTPEPIGDPIHDDLWMSEGVTMAWRRRRSDRYVAERQLDMFVKEWEDAIREAPASPLPHMELAKAYGYAGQLDDAVSSFDRAIALDPNDALAHLGRGNALTRLGQTDAAIAAYEKALELDPTLYEAQGNLGSVLIQSERVDEGLQRLRDAAESLPNNADAWFNLAIALRGAGRDEEAKTTFERVLAIDPDHARANFERGVMLATDGDFTGAVATFQKVVAEQPRVASAYVNLGQAYLAIGQTPDAIETFKAGLVQFPREVRLLAALSWIYATNKEEAYRDGLAAVRLATRLVGISKQRNADHFDILAAACAEHGDFEPAIRYAGNALEIAAAQVEATNDPERRRRMNEMQKRLELYHAGKPFRDPR